MICRQGFETGGDPGGGGQESQILLGRRIAVHADEVPEGQSLSRGLQGDVGIAEIRRLAEGNQTPTAERLAECHEEVQCAADTAGDGAGGRKTAQLVSQRQLLWIDDSPPQAFQIPLEVLLPLDVPRVVRELRPRQIEFFSAIIVLESGQLGVDAIEPREEPADVAEVPAGESVPIHH